tara:strand:- start:5965 stop:10656 length:4692 start_codon:yes stop_codon:yes gene_type:complete
MNEKCAMDSINSNMHFLGLLLLVFILIVVIIFFYNNIIKKHDNIIEKYVTNDYGYSSIDKISNYGSGSDFNTHSDSELKTYEIDDKNKIHLRKCSVFFVGEEDETIADSGLWLLVDKSEIDEGQAKGYGNFIKLNQQQFIKVYNLVSKHFANDNEETKKITDPSILNESNSDLYHNDKIDQIQFFKPSLKLHNKRWKNKYKFIKYLILFSRDKNGLYSNKELNKLFNENQITTYNYLEIEFEGKKYYMMPLNSKNKLLHRVCSNKRYRDKNNTCGYEYEDNWFEIDYTTTEDENGNKVNSYNPYKIYNQEYTNYNKENSQNMMKSCFKLNKYGKNIKFKYNQNGMVEYDYSGVDDDNSIIMKHSGNYINMNFENNEDASSNYRDIIDNICSFKRNKINDEKLANNTKYIKFILNDKLNVESVQYVKMNENQTGFDKRENDIPQLIEDAAFGMMMDSYDINPTTGRYSLHFKVFKSINVPTIQNVEIFKFTYNYLCDNNITHFYKKSAKMNLGNLIIPPNPNIQYSPNKLSYYFNDLEIDSSFWNTFIQQTKDNVDNPISQKKAIINALNDQKEAKLNEIIKRYLETKGDIQNMLVNPGISDPITDMGIIDNFTNYKENFKINDLKQYYTKNELERMGTIKLGQIEKGWMDKEKEQLSKQNLDISQMFKDINDLTAQDFTDPYGTVVPSDASKTFGFTEGFLFRLILTDTNSVYSAKNKFSTVEALNHRDNIPITLVSDNFLSLKDHGIKRAEMHAYHQNYSHTNRVIRAAARGSGLHPRHQRSWHEGGYWPTAKRADNGSVRGGTPHHTAGFHRTRVRRGRYYYYLWLGRGRVDSWSIMKGKMDRGDLIAPITNNTKRLNKSNWSDGKNYYTQIYRTYFLAPHTGSYEWEVISDDAGMLYSKQVYPVDNGKIHQMLLVVDNAGLHSPRPRSGKIDMVAGRVYELHGTFTERSGRDIFEMSFIVNGYNNNEKNYNVISKNKDDNGNFTAHYYQNMSTISSETRHLENIKWSMYSDGNFYADIEALADKPFNMNKIKFINTIITTNIMPEQYNSINVDDKELSKYYNFYVKGNSKKLFFKISLTESGLNAKYNMITIGDSYNEGEKSTFANDYSSHVDVLDNKEYFNIGNDDIITSIPTEIRIEPWSFVRFIVCGYIYLDEGNYKFYVNNNIPSQHTYKDNKFILQGRNDKILERITENNKDIKVKVSGFYKYSHNCFVQNNSKETLDVGKSLVEIKNRIEDIKNTNYGKQATIDELNKIFNYSTSADKDILNLLVDVMAVDTNNDFINTVLEFKWNQGNIIKDTEMDIPSYVSKIKFMRDTSTKNDLIEYSLEYVETLIDVEVNYIGRALFPKFELKCDYESLDGKKSYNKRELSNVLYTGKRMHEYYSEGNDHLFEGVKSFENFSNYKEKFSNNLGPYLNEQEGRGKDLHHITGIKTILKQLKGVISQKNIKRDEEIRNVKQKFEILHNQLSQQNSYKKYFDEYIVEFKKNPNIGSIINNSSQDGADVSTLTDSQKNYIYNHITYEKIPNINDRTTSDLNNVNFRYKDKSDLSFYVLESSITG